MGPLPEYLKSCCPPADGEVCRTGENPYSGVGALKAVSYTHLDVYKRQTMMRASAVKRA